MPRAPRTPVRATPDRAPDRDDDPVTTLTPRRIALTMLVAAAVYTVLTLPALGLHRPHVFAYRISMNALFGSFDGGRVEFVSAKDVSGGSGFDTSITFRARQNPKQIGTTVHSARITGYLPAAQTLALCIATPIAWRRRLALTLKALALIHVFIALRVLIIILYWFSQPGPCAMYAPGRWVGGVLTNAFEFFAVAPTCTFVAPLVVWAVLVPWRWLRLSHAATPAST